MKFSETKIKECYVIGCEPMEDERGIFFRTFDRNEFRATGLKKDFVQHNVSINAKKGTVRGMHFQFPPYSELKLIHCITGKIFDVVIDLRKSSTTFLQWICVELSPSAFNLLLIPEGCAHGFQTLEDHSTLLYYHTSAYRKESEGGIRYDDPLFKITWPLPVSMISERDQNHPLLAPTFKGLDA